MRAFLLLRLDSEALVEDRTVTTARGDTLTAPARFRLTRDGRRLILDAPESDLRLTITELNEQMTVRAIARRLGAPLGRGHDPGRSRDVRNQRTLIHRELQHEYTSPK